MVSRWETRKLWLQSRWLLPPPTRKKKNVTFLKEQFGIFGNTPACFCSECQTRRSTVFLALTDKIKLWVLTSWCRWWDPKSLLCWLVRGQFCQFPPVLVFTLSYANQLLCYSLTYSKKANKCFLKCQTVVKWMTAGLSLKDKWKSTLRALKSCTNLKTHNCKSETNDTTGHLHNFSTGDVTLQKEIQDLKYKCFALFVLSFFAY